MADIRTLLRQGDPAAGAGLDARERDQIRRRAIEAVPNTPRRHVMLTLALAMGLAMVVVARTWMVSQVPPATAPLSGQASLDTRRPAADAAPRRQLQFATPGGTRVIWTLDASSDIR